MNDCMLTYTKVRFCALSPEAGDICIEDIAHALSMMTRANGHFPEFYSVGQHSIQCAGEAKAQGLGPDVVLACLLHDASEAYLADIIRPVKKSLDAYIRAEERLQNMIYQKFLGHVPQGEAAAQVRAVDDACLYYEFLHFMGEKVFPKAPKTVGVFSYVPQPMQEVEEEYLALYHQYAEAVRSHQGSGGTSGEAEGDRGV